MPKKKKNAQSPARIPRSTGDGEVSSAEARDRDGETLGQNQEQIWKGMQEMFSHLDPSVIFMVLSESQFKAENAMDALLELSDAASSQWQETDVLDQQLAQPEPFPRALESLTASDHVAAADTASLVNQEPEILTFLKTQPLDSLDSLDPPSQMQSSQSLLHHAPLDPEHLDLERRDVSVDFSHLTKDASVQSSAFTAYRRPEQGSDPTLRAPGTRDPAVMLNIQAPEFHPHAGVPAFITPVVTQAPNAWNRHLTSAGHWLAGSTVSQNLQRPNAVFSRASSHPPQNRLRLEGKVLVLLRGAPGSGKTTLARKMLQFNPGGVICSTDEYFVHNGTYRFEPNLLGEAHAWNHQRAKEAFEKGFTPIIIDNTNMQCWEMKPYVAMALNHKYKVLFREPDTWWKHKPRELMRRTKHGVTKEKIQRMLDHQDRHVTVRNIMSSQPKSDVMLDVETHQVQTAPTHSVSKSHISSVLNAAKCELESHVSEEEPPPSHESVSEENGTLKSELLDGEALDRDLDACIHLLESADLNVNEVSGLSEERVPDQHMAFSDSIAQRVRKERGCRRFADGLHLNQPPDSSVREDQEEEEEEEEVCKEDCTQDAELLHFVGDWPSESLEQREQWSRKSDNGDASSGVRTPTNGDPEVGVKDHLGPAPDVKDEKSIGTALGESPVASPQPPDLPPQQSHATAQTDPLDFSLLWRIEHQKSNEPTFIKDVVIMEGSPFRFVPSGGVQEKSSNQHGVPYHVSHEKGSQVEESDLKKHFTEQESLNILQRFFKLVPMETLEDLYDKCHQDVEWTINLLLDSGETLFRDDAESPLAAGEERLRSEVTESSDSHIEPDVRNLDQALEDGEHDDRDFTDTLPGQDAGRSPLVAELSEAKQPAGLQEATSDSAEEMFDQEDLDAIIQLVLAQFDEEEHQRKEERKGRGKEKQDRGGNFPMHIQKLELKLPTELALQLTELFGPVGISPGEFAPDDCSVLMDLNLAKLLHQKWKETIQERQRQAALSYQLLQESSVHWGDTQPAVAGISMLGQSGVQEGLPFMDHWNTSRQPVSLRNIMLEEQEMQDLLEQSRLSYSDVDKKDGAAVLKENELLSHFPAIDRHFIRDIFRDHNYSLEKTELFLRNLFDDGPVKNVMAPEATPERNANPRASSKERTWKLKGEAPQFQDTEDPDYEDFRTEAVLQRRRQQECYSKAAEAYRQGHKDVASFYAQQGRLHGQKVKEANHRAAVQIFERVNATLLPQNVLDLHGLHVDEALHHLSNVLMDKTTEWQQGLCRPQLSIITGRGNRSQGGVARIRPAVLDYLKSQHYKFTEPNEGLVVVRLQ